MLLSLLIIGNVVLTIKIPAFNKLNYQKLSLSIRILSAYHPKNLPALLKISKLVTIGKEKVTK